MTFSGIISSVATTDVPFDVDGLRHALLAQRQYTLALYADLPSTYWNPSQFPAKATINPPLWELAHIALTRGNLGSCLLFARYVERLVGVGNNV